MAKASTFGGNRNEGLSPLDLTEVFGTDQLGNNESRSIRLYVRGLKHVMFHIQGAVAGTDTVNIYPMLAGATDDDTDGALRAPAGAVEETLSDGVDTRIEQDLDGEEYLEIEVSNGASGTFTLTYLHAFAVPYGA